MTTVALFYSTICKLQNPTSLIYFYLETSNHQERAD